MLPATDLHRLNSSCLRALSSLEERSQPLPWTQAQLAEELDHPQAIVWGIYMGELLVAYAVCRRIVDEWWLLNIATDPGHRRCGHGDALMAALCTQARADQLPVWLEVRASNLSAQRLYGRHGLAEVGRRPGYYRAIQPGDAPEEAIMMMSQAT